MIEIDLLFCPNSVEAMLQILLSYIINVQVKASLRTSFRSVKFIVLGHTLILYSTCSNGPHCNVGALLCCPVLLWKKICGWASSSLSSAFL